MNSELTKTGEPLRLVIRGRVPSFKNNKRTDRNGTPRTDKKTRLRMREIEADLLSQLNSAWETACKTQTGLCAALWIRSVAPSDDSLSFIREIHLTADLMMPGEEMTTIEIR